MPNTKSAERRVRNSARRNQHNRSIRSKIKTLEKSYLSAVESGKKDDATSAYRALNSALDRSAKVGVIHPNTARRKKSRLSVSLNAISG